MRQDLLYARQSEDPYSAHPQPLVEVAFAFLPVFLLVLALGSAVLHLAYTRAVIAVEPSPDVTARGLWKRSREPLKTVFALYVVRGVIVAAGVLASMTLCVGVAVGLDAFTSLRPFRGGGPFDTVNGVASMLLPVALLLRLGFVLAPAASAVDGLPPRAALRRSWQLVWSRRTWPQTGAVVVPTVGYVIGAYLLFWHAAEPLRPAADSWALAHVTSNTYAAHAAGVVAPVAVAVLLTATVTLPVAHTALTALYLRLRDRPTGGRGEAASRGTVHPPSHDPGRER
jgi:hypothetical protein